MTEVQIRQWTNPPCRLALQPGEIQVWTANLDGRQPGDFWPVLSDEERERADRLRNPRQAQRFGCARGILRELLGAYLGKDPWEIAFETNPQGKPTLTGGDRALSFNMSHSSGLAVYAVASGYKVGVDVEAVRPLDNLAEMAEMTLTETEREDLIVFPDDNRTVFFFKLWTSKEAVLKMMGSGLTYSMKKLECRILNLDQDSYEVTLSDGRCFSVTSLPLGDGYTGSLAAARGR